MGGNSLSQVSAEESNEFSYRANRRTPGHPRDQRSHVEQQLKERIASLSRNIQWMEERLHTERDAKRRLLLRSVHEANARTTVNEVANLKLTGSGVGDEQVHALATLFFGIPQTSEDSTLKKRNFQSRSTSYYCRPRPLNLPSLRLVDFQVLAEALERNERGYYVAQNLPISE
ncbi:hypothetical protein PsorP6_005590 [Peronosclerospora sorghi]|uniref:Uncharacterized protein n=1 Tax=Peronosclerospora sorghi TaxID=230839 RepID=A0ACC0W3A2_9STRA|nr:hypothetical protein PsorP6_005590 [Peronosclerospora sorghi]